MPPKKNNTKSNKSDSDAEDNKKTKTKTKNDSDDDIKNTDNINTRSILRNTIILSI